MRQCNDTLSAHMFIEMYFNGRNKRRLNENKFNYRNFKILCEEYGVFDGCYEQAVEICNYVKKMKSLSLRTSELKPHYIDFANNIEINLKNKSGSCYLPEASKVYYDRDNNSTKYYRICLDIGIQQSDESLISSTMHELTHAYEDYKRHNNSPTSIHSTSMKIGYYKNPVGLAETYRPIKRAISYFLYFTTDFEINAFIPQIAGDMKQCNIKFNNAEDAMEYINAIPTYTNYKIVLNWGKQLTELTSRNMQNLIVKEANHLSENKFKTYSQFCKWVLTKIRRVEKRLYSVIPKLAMRYLNIKSELPMN